MPRASPRSRLLLPRRRPLLPRHLRESPRCPALRQGRGYYYREEDHSFPAISANRHDVPRFAKVAVIFTEKKTTSSPPSPRIATMSRASPRSRSFLPRRRPLLPRHLRESRRCPALRQGRGHFYREEDHFFPAISANRHNVPRFAKVAVILIEKKTTSSPPSPRSATMSRASPKSRSFLPRRRPLLPRHLRESPRCPALPM